MNRYAVIALPGGWVVAVKTATGRQIAVSDHASRDSASVEAERLNRAWSAAESRRLNMGQQHAIADRLARLRLRLADLA